MWELLGKLWRLTSKFLSRLGRGVGRPVITHLPPYSDAKGSIMQPYQYQNADIMIKNLVKIAHTMSVTRGWWEGIDLKDVNTIPVKLCLIHSEISEAMEGFRCDLQDDKLPHRKAIEVELVDALLRIFDLAGAMDLDLGGAFIEKLSYNKKRKDHSTEERNKSNGKRF